MRTIDFLDGYETATVPSTGQLTDLNVFASDAAFETDKGSPGAAGDLYYNSTTNNMRYFRTGDGWVNVDAVKVVGTTGSPTLITAVGGISGPSDAQHAILHVAGNGGAIDITANPQISAGVFTGQKITIVGHHDTNTVKLEHGTGLVMNGSCFLANGSVIMFLWDGTSWVEMARNDI